MVSCYGRDLKDLTGAIATLEAWDRQLLDAQVFIETKIVKECDKSVVDNYERQLREMQEIEARRNEILLELNNPQ